ncbi:hypothetical protein EVAR_76374_1 [Eumeta japonica]|uniref:Uncharacterized protein n=1 Tax=Eumeta variegata TaxID=151549 RepID=A0A4C1TAT1_EUMVA|nr:hypothetical protein EVAR_76374_1 [Eumeta japonica]
MISNARRIVHELAFATIATHHRSRREGASSGADTFAGSPITFYVGAPVCSGARTCIGAHFYRLQIIQTNLNVVIRRDDLKNPTSPGNGKFPSAFSSASALSSRFPVGRNSQEMNVSR